MKSGEHPAVTRNPNLDLHPHPHLPQARDPLVGPRPETWWTGVPPARCPGLNERGELNALPTPDLSSCTRESVRDYFDNGWTLSELLFSSLQGQQAFETPPWHRLRHPLVFYFCHPAVLYVNKLRLAGLGSSLSPDFEALFETGVDEMSWDDLALNELDWPGLDQVTDYRRRVYQLVRSVIDTHPGLEPDHKPITEEHPLWALFMGFEHERIHLETSSVLIRELPVEWVRHPSTWPAVHPSARRPAVPAPRSARDYPLNPLIEVPPGSVSIGKKREETSWGWDNEYGLREVELEAFRTQRFLVSNGEFLEFVRAEGYLDQTLWTKDGWGWRQFRNAKWPAFWVSTGPAGLHDYRLRVMFEVLDMPWSWPVEVNFHEAEAYRAWRERRDGSSYRLMSEARHHRLRALSPEGSSGVNAGLRCGSPRPVDEGQSPGAADVFGNVWQWCEDHFHSLPGFRVHRLYDDFSTPCFDGKHQLILGGSFVSTGAEATRWARFHFRPHFSQHAGFRLTSGDTPAEAVRLDARPSHDVYERDDAFEQYMLLHYGRQEDVLPPAAGMGGAIDFPRRCAERLLALAKSEQLTARRALDVGCAVGRSSFELTRGFDDVVAIDRSERFIRAANTMQERGSLSYFLRDEGELGRDVLATVAPELDRRRVRFRVADACSLPADLVGFDAVMGANLLCRLPRPRAFLDRLSGPRGLVRPGGLLFLTTPGTWSTTFTPREEWLGGLSRGGEEVHTFDGLRDVLEAHFELLVHEDIPLLIREHRRKYQFIVSELTVWRRRNGS